MLCFQEKGLLRLGEGPGGPGGPGLLPLILGKKRRNDWREIGQQGKKIKTVPNSSPPPPPVTQGLDPPLLLLTKVS